MRCFKSSGRRMLIVGVFLTVGVCAVSNAWADKSKSRQPKSSGQIKFKDDSQEYAIFKFHGTEEQIGRFTAVGELDFVPGDQAGTREGAGVVIIHAGCDRLVGVATLHLDANTNESSFRFSWRDSVTLSNGKTLSNTGRFVTNRPTGLVVVVGTSEPAPTPKPNIILILIKIILRT